MDAIVRNLSESEALPQRPGWAVFQDMRVQRFVFRLCKNDELAHQLRANTRPTTFWQQSNIHQRECIGTALCTKVSDALVVFKDDVVVRGGILIAVLILLRLELHPQQSLSLGVG